MLKSVREGLKGLLTILGQQLSDFAQDSSWEAASQYLPRQQIEGSSLPPTANRYMWTSMPLVSVEVKAAARYLGPSWAHALPLIVFWVQLHNARRL